MLIIFINAHTLLLGNQILQCTSYPIHFILCLSLTNGQPGVRSCQCLYMQILTNLASWVSFSPS